MPKQHALPMRTPAVLATLDGCKTQVRLPITRRNSLFDGHQDTPWPVGVYAWDKAWVDQGPSPAGNPGPYLKLPCIAPEGDRPVHRIYPKWQPGDLLWVRRDCRAAYLWLRVTDVRVQRVHEISDADVRAEGVEQRHIDKMREWLHPGDVHGHAFGELWDATYAKRGYSWASNSWIWAIAFERCAAPQL